MTEPLWDVPPGVRVKRGLPAWGASGITFLVTLVAAFIVLHGAVYRTFLIPTGAMSPTLPIGSRVLVDHDQHPRVGDIVVFRTDWGPTPGDYVKRVLAIGGQTVTPGTTVLVDGQPLREPYVEADHNTQSAVDFDGKPFAPVHLMPGQLWVEGDFRDNSADSRVHGPISSSTVIGVVRQRGSAAHVYGYLLGLALLLAVALAGVVGVVQAARRRRSARPVQPDLSW